MNKMIVGITGGIGSGKTIVSRILKIMGYSVFAADEESKMILDGDADVRKQVTELLGTGSYTNGKADRQFIAKEVFHNPGKLDRLNAILHPAVRDRFLQWTKEQPGNLVFKEAAILFESGSNRDTHAVIGVIAPESVRINRVIERDGKSEQEVRLVMDKQLSQSELEEKCDFLIDNDGNHLLVPQVLQVIAELKKRF